MIQNGILTPKEVIIQSLICYGLALAIGIWLISELGLTILWLGLIGAFCGFFYTAPPFKLIPPSKRILPVTGVNSVGENLTLSVVDPPSSCDIIPPGSISIPSAPPL